MKQELENLIQAVLQDGVVTAKEREVLHKKAEALGEDPDEVDIFLDAGLQKKEQNVDAAKRQQMSRTCPYCGGGIPQLAEKCPHCGENITAAADKELVEIIENLEEALVNLKSGEDIDRSKATVERYSRKAKMFFNNNPKVKALIAEVEEELVNASKKATFDKLLQTSSSGIKVILKYIFIDHKRIVALIGLVLIGWIGYTTFFRGEEEKYEEEMEECQEISEDLEADMIDKDYDSAVDNIKELESHGWRCKDDIKIIVHYYLSQDDLEEALDISTNYMDPEEFGNEKIVKEFYQYYMKKDMFEEVEDLLGSEDCKEEYNYYKDRIKKFKQKGEIEEGKDFIRKNMFDESSVKYFTDFLEK